MARPLRIEYPGALYHLTSRGNARGMIFDDDGDRDLFLDTLGRVVRKFHWICYGYCLMDNHYHLLIQTPEANLARGMRQLNGIYTQAFNRRHRRVGHLLQGRYKAILVEKDAYLLELCRYIVRNPVAAGLVACPAAWPWSSYRSTAGEAPTPAFLSTDWILGHFGTDRQKAVQGYRHFVDGGLESPAPWNDLRGVLLGGDSFVGRLEPFLSEWKNHKEVPHLQRLSHRPALEKLLSEAALADRAKAAARAHEWGYTLKEIAHYLGIHYSTVSRMVKRQEWMLHCKT